MAHLQLKRRITERGTEDVKAFNHDPQKSKE